MSAEVAQLPQLACTLAREAGELLRERYDSGSITGVQSKSTPTDLVSEADLAAERLLRARIRHARPHDGILGEEGEDVHGSSGLRWVIDPLDGTVNFLFGIPQWSVSVAVQEVGEGAGAAAAVETAQSQQQPAEPLLGARTLAAAIYDPCRGEMWSAVRDGEALLDGAPVHGSRRHELATAMLATGLAYDARLRARQARVLARLIPRVRDIRRLGSAALDLAWAAAGRYDAYYERAVEPWDVAAGVLICEAAGLVVAELPEQDGLPAGVLAAAPGIAQELQTLVS
ncbi:MAG: inositol monophosphatase family protein [Solirubrobacteraceae bacterium]